MENTTVSVFGGRIARYMSALVWSPLPGEKNKVSNGNPQLQSSDSGKKITWRPFWQGTCPEWVSSHGEFDTTLGHCCQWLQSQSRCNLQLVVMSWCGYPPRVRGIILSSEEVGSEVKGLSIDSYLFTREGDHIERAIHEASRQILGAVLQDNDIISSMIRGNILWSREEKLMRLQDLRLIRPG